ncbi:MAG: glycosyltransferase family 2 protein [Tepidisphaerales bacterium]
MNVRTVYHRLVPRSNPELLSVVIPFYNEEDVLPLIRSAFAGLPEMPRVQIEFILVNDGSTDNTLEQLLAWADADPRVTVVGLARNFGHQAALTAGLDLAAGDAVITMDADLQDPPEVIPEMLAEYRRGYDVVYARRTARHGEGAFKRFCAWLFYRLMRWLVHRDLPADCGDFRLVSRRCLDALKTMREEHRFLRGMVAWVGFAQTTVPFERHPRAAGETKYPLHKLIRLAWTAAISFSPAPLRLSLGFGMGLALVGFADGAYAVARYLLGYSNPWGWTSLMVVVCLVGAAILISIGILGEYIGRIFEQMKGRPLYIVSLTAGALRRQPTRIPPMLLEVPAASIDGRAI